MSKLVLSRRGGESLRLELTPGFFLTVEVLEVNFDKGVLMKLSAGGHEELATVKMGRTLNVVDGVAITVAAIAFKQVRLSIEAPKSVKILRAEIIDVPAV